MRARFERSVYVDRVVVAERAHGGVLARRLYAAVFAQTVEAEHEQVVCEVNSDPPNSASDAFHAALGFELIGTAATPRGKTVRYLAALWPYCAPDACRTVAGPTHSKHASNGDGGL